MKKLITPGILMVILVIIVCCEQAKDTSFLVTAERVGKLQRTDLLEDIPRIYKEDSIVKDTLLLSLGSPENKLKIYEKGGKHLLTLTPSTDSIARIEHLRIFDPRFLSEKGVGLGSNFKEIRESYSIRKIVTSGNNVVIFVKESPMYFTISKEELPASLRYAASTNIEAVQIPDKARIKYLMVGWDRAD